mmetsp:Transcript_14496/g.31808  ORF Transcript_14496/g.31808 Transcript_14496/m.31808 type:complete len:421 (-) Transcript_14496:46-1308(-)
MNCRRRRLMSLFAGLRDELHDDTGHVVSPESARFLGIHGDAIVQKGLHDGREALAARESLPDKVADLLIRLDIPDPIARQHDEFIVLVERNPDDVWSCAYHLSLRAQLRRLLVLQIADRPRQVQIAHHSIMYPLTDSGLLHVAPCSLYPLPLHVAVGFVVVRQLDRFSFPTENGARIPCVATDDLVVVQKHANGSAPDILGNLCVRGCLARSLLALEALEQRHLHHHLMRLLSGQRALLPRLSQVASNCLLQKRHDLWFFGGSLHILDTLELPRGVLYHVLLRRLLLRLQRKDLLPILLFPQHVVDRVETIYESLPAGRLFAVQLLLQPPSHEVRHVDFTESRHLPTAVPIEDAEEGPSLQGPTQAGDRNVSVLHARSPTLHAAATPFVSRRRARLCLLVCRRPRQVGPHCSPGATGSFG